MVSNRSIWLRGIALVLTCAALVGECYQWVSWRVGMQVASAFGREGTREPSMARTGPLLITVDLGPGQRTLAECARSRHAQSGIPYLKCHVLEVTAGAPRDSAVRVGVVDTTDFHWRDMCEPVSDSTGVAAVLMSGNQQALPESAATALQRVERCLSPPRRQ